MVAPVELRTYSSLMVMGSEGRREQTVRTDQDNGIILSRPIDPDTLERFRREFSEDLDRFGFPPCPGGVMVRNVAWSRPLDEYLEDFRRWIAMPTETSHMNVAIIYDARSVAGGAPEMLST